MRAFLCEELGANPRLGDLPRPRCGPDEVVIDVEAAGLNFADLLVGDGTYQVVPDPPFALGFEAAGTIIRVGAKVEGHAVGDHVITFGVGGAFAEQRATRADWAFPLPPRMTAVEAAGWFIPYSTAYHALVDRGYLAGGETLLVLGASGGVGQAAVALGRVLGARVIAAASTEEKAAAARGLGAHHIVRYDREDLAESVLEFTEGRGADVVYDPVGGDYFRDAVRATGFLGRILIVGFASGSAPSIGMNIALVKGISLVGVDFGRYIRERPSLAAEVHAELVELWEDEVLDDLTSRVLALEDLPGVHSRFTDREVIGKWVVEISRGPASP